MYVVWVYIYKFVNVITTYLLTPWCRVLLEKLTGLQLVKKFPAFHGTRRFITALTSVRHVSLYWASPIQSIYPHPTSWRSILILSTHLGLGLPSCLLPSGFPTKNLYSPLSSSIRFYNNFVLNLKSQIKSLHLRKSPFPILHIYLDDGYVASRNMALLLILN